MKKNQAYSLKELAALTNSKLIGNPDHMITGVADLESASTSDASFFSNARYLHAFNHSTAGVIFIGPEIKQSENKNYLISERPSAAFQYLIDLFHPQRTSPSGFTGIHSSAVIHSSAKIGEGVSIGPHATIDEGVVIGNHTFIGAGTYIGADSRIGSNCLIHPRVTIREHSEIGNRVIIQPGAVIGSCGFGYVTNAQGIHVKLNQVGNVQIEDDVEIGANTTIDRSRFKSTIIQKGSKIDNLVQLGHGVTIGRHNLIVSQTGIAGSTTTGEYVVLGGQVAIAGHLKIGDHVMVAGKSGVTKSLVKGKYGGIPAQPLEEYNRNQVFLRNIEKYMSQIKKS